MAVHHLYDETGGHPALAAAMAERRPFWRVAISGSYFELMSVAGKRAVAASRQEKPPIAHVDRLVTLGDLVSLDYQATDCIIAGMVHHGLMRYIGDDKFQLIEHDKLMHSMTAMQLWWEARKRRDTRNEAYRLEVLWRDGDQCRCCRVVMKHTKGNDTDPDGFTLDHRNPGVPAESADDLAAVCRRCNGIRSDADDANIVAPWQPVPSRPFYTIATANHLRAKGYLTDPLGKPMMRTGKDHKLAPIPIRSRPTNQVDPALEGQGALSGASVALSSDLEAIEVPLPAQWAWTAHEGTKCRICGTRPAATADTAREATVAPSSAAVSPVSDPETIGAPLAPKPRENLAKTAGKPPETEPPKPSPPSTKPTSLGRGRAVGDGLGWSDMASGLGGTGRRARGRRSAKPRVQQVKQDKEQS